MTQPDFFAASPQAPAYVPDPRFGSGTAPAVLPAGPPPARHGAARRSSSLKRTRMVIGGVVAVVAVAGYLGFSHLLNSESAAETTTLTTSLQAAHDVEIKSDLREAAVAMESSFADKGTYPRDLRGAGFTSSAATTVRLVWATGTGFCLAGGVGGAAPTWWYASEQGGLVQQAC